MKTIPANPVEVAALCTEVGIFGIKLSHAKAVKILLLVGDHNLCIDALLMDPRPAWVEKMVGPISKG